MADRIARLPWPLDVDEERAAVLPVPLALSRERERGFNQSERIARALAERWRIPTWCDVLERARSTQTQTRLTPKKRLANHWRALRFRYAGRPALRKAHVALGAAGCMTTATLHAGDPALM